MVEVGGGVGFGDEVFCFRVPVLDEEGWGVGGGRVDVEPGSVADGLGAGGAGEDEVPAAWEVFDSLEAGGGGEGEEVDAAERTGWDVEEQDRRRLGIYHGWEKLITSEVYTADNIYRAVFSLGHSVL